MCFIKSLNKISFEIHQQCILTAEVSKGPQETLQPQLQQQVDSAPQNAVKHRCQFLHISVLKPFEGRQAPKFLFEWCHVQTKAANNLGWLGDIFPWMPHRWYWLVKSAGGGRGSVGPGEHGVSLKKGCLGLGCLPARRWHFHDWQTGKNILI